MKGLSPCDFDLIPKMKEPPASGSLPQGTLWAAAVSGPSALNLEEVASLIESWGVAQHLLINTCGVARPGRGVLWVNTTHLALLSEHFFMAA